MSIDDLVKGVKIKVQGVHDYLSVPGKGRKTAEYAVRHYLPDHYREELFGNKSEEEIELLYSDLERSIDKRIHHHKDNLGKLSRKLAVGTGIAALLDEAYHIIRMTPASMFVPTVSATIYAKALLELPTMYKYMKDTGDMYGLMEWLIAKPLALLVPILGTGYDINVTGRIIKKRAIKEGMDDFLKEKGLIKERKAIIHSIADRVKEKTGFSPEPEMLAA